MLLTADIGNTESVLGLFNDHNLIAHWRFATWPERTADELALLIRGLMRDAGCDPAALTAASIASVVPPMTPLLEEVCTRAFRIPAHFVDARASLPIRLNVEEPLTVGADRIANTLAAATLYKRDTVAVDLGTATTFDCISARGEFLGGVISPGVHTGAESLVRRTAKLPRIDLIHPDRVIGRRTESALQSGIFFGAVDAIDGIVRRIKADWGAPDIFVVATGGLAPLIAPYCQTIDHVEPYLTLLGLEIAYRHLGA